MSNNTSNNTIFGFERLRDGLNFAWGFLTEAHTSIVEIGERRRAQLIAGLTLGTSLLVMAALLANPSAPETFIALLTLSLVSFSISRTRYFRLAAYFFSFGITSDAFINIYSGSARSIESTITGLVPIALILSSALLSQRGFILLGIFTIVATVAIPSYADPRYFTDPNLSITRVTGLMGSIALFLLGISYFRNLVERARLDEIKSINTEFEYLTENLEARVAERTADLEKANELTSKRAERLQSITELSEVISKVEKLERLFPEITRLISDRFGFYHVGIFLVDEKRQFAVLEATNSDGGQLMLANGHRLKLGTGVVGFAAKTGEPRIALDVGDDAVFFDNPFLPETHSEAALPLIARETVVGVLDVQSTERRAFTQDDLLVLSTLANQVSIAFENIRLLTEARAAFNQVQEIYNEYTRSEWSRVTKTSEQLGFSYKDGKTNTFDEYMQGMDVLSAVKSGRFAVAVTGESETKKSTIAIPVKIRGEVIGILHIESNDVSREWNKEEINLIEAVAERASTALENARLFQEARKRAAKEFLISEAGTRISSALNVENILRITADELGRVLGGSEVLIQFQNTERNA